MGQRSDKVAISAIIGLETTTFCSRECPWCPNPSMDHKVMTDEVFERSLEVLVMFPPVLIAMNGCGEPLTDPKFVERVKRVHDTGYTPYIFTNGDFLHPAVVEGLKDAGLKKICLSEHGDIDEKMAMIQGCGMDVSKAYSPAKGGRTHNFAGQLPVENTLENVCNPLQRGWFYINVEGHITQCCLDYDAKYPVGNVFDNNIPKIRSTQIPLCDDCTGSP